MDARTLFKKLVADAKKELTREVVLTQPRDIMSYGSQRASDFKKDTKNRGAYDGKHAHLTDEYIDSLNDKDLEDEMVTFIYKCFQSR